MAQINIPNDQKMARDLAEQALSNTPEGNPMLNGSPDIAESGLISPEDLEEWNEEVLEMFWNMVG